MTKNWTVYVMGFTQDLGTLTRLQRAYDRTCKQIKPETDRVLLFPWNADWNAVAEHIFRFSQNGDPPRIRACGYSWGAGWGVWKLCRELDRRNVRIDRLALIDPVHRHPNPLRRWRTLTSLIPRVLPTPILYPNNIIGDVLWFGQKKNWPRSHPVVIEGRAKQPEINMVDCIHEYMDDDEATIAECYEFLIEET